MFQFACLHGGVHGSVGHRTAANTKNVDLPKAISPISGGIRYWCATMYHPSECLPLATSGN